MQFIYRLRNPVQSYAWGSHTIIADLLGRPSPTPHPQAELWIGAHPRGKSIAIAEVGEVPLDKLVSSSASALLGRKVARAFKNKLPFLLKILAAEQPLSLQVHPNREQAYRGYRREQAAEIPRDSPERNYRDRNHKPELVCALTRFSVLHGFRPRTEALDWLRRFDVSSLRPSVEQLERDTHDEATGRFFLRLLELEGPARHTVCEEIRDAHRRLGEQGDPELRWMARLLELYPEDPGVLAPLLLNLIELEPGQALYTEAGILHSYLGGTAVEIQANSDNVLRGGLTDKHVDLEELRHLLHLEPSEEVVLEGEQHSQVETLFVTEAREFVLERLDLEDCRGYSSRDDRFVEILLCVEGEVTFESRNKTVVLKQGHSVLVAASAPPYEITGSGVVFLATVPEPRDVPLAPWEIEEAEAQARLEMPSSDDEQGQDQEQEEDPEDDPDREDPGDH